MKLKLAGIILITLLIGGLVGYYFGQGEGLQKAVSRNGAIENIEIFEECVSAGYPVMESYPRKCSTGDNTFIEDIGNELEKSEFIRIDNPRPNSVIESPLEVTGEARGTWYFEASFSVYLYDNNGKELAQGAAEAKGDWMTEEFVPFTAAISFDTPDTEKGELVLEKANPSGLSENEDELRVPVRFQ